MPRVRLSRCRARANWPTNHNPHNEPFVMAQRAGGTVSGNRSVHAEVDGSHHGYRTDGKGPGGKSCARHVSRRVTIGAPP